MIKYLKYQFFFVVLVMCISVFSQVNYRNGKVFLHDYREEDKAKDQTWAIIQDNRDVMYFGTNSGIVEYDGNKWQMILLSNNSGIRSMDKDSAGIVYVGGTGEFGYLASDSTGQISYISLKSYLDSLHTEFTDVWQVKVTNTGVYFVTRNWVFRWYMNQMSVVKSKLDSFYGLIAGEKLFVVERAGGIHEVKDDTTYILPFTEQIMPDTGLFSLLPFSDNSLLFLNDKQFYIYNYDLVEHYAENYANEIDSTLFFTPFKSEIQNFVRENKLYSSISLNEDLYAIGTIRNGIVFFNSIGEFLDIFNKDNGLYDNTILSLFQDKFGDLWIGTNNGIMRLEINNPLTVFNDENGLEGSVLTTIEHNGIRYAGTNYGVFRLDEYKKDGFSDVRYKSISPNKSSYWCFLPYDDILLTSGDYGLETVLYNTTKEVLETEKIFSFGRSYRYPNTVFIGMLDSFGYFQVKRNRKNNKTDFYNYNTLEDIKETIRIIATDSVGNLWASSEYNGIYHIQFHNYSLDSTIITKYDTIDGLPRMDFNYVYNIDNRILIGTASGLYTLNLNDGKSTKKYTIVPDTSYGSVFIKKDNIISDIVLDKKNKLWINAEYGIGPVKKLDGKYIWDTIPFKRLKGYELHFENGNNLWVNNFDGLYKYNLDQKYEYGKSFNALIRKVYVGKDSTIFAGAYFDQRKQPEQKNYIVSLQQPKKLIPELTYDDNSISFVFSAPYYIESKKVLFKYMLQGFDDEWSDWVVETKKEYTNLREGSYTFIVKAKNIYGNTSNEAYYQFKITPPWYRTFYAYLAYLIVIAVLFYLAIFLNSRRLRAANLKLERIVKQRTHEIEKQKEDILERNIEISRQKEEIAGQANQLELTNIELEKLSIVASKTDNAVIIMDAKGKFQWINEGFTRMYGYAIDDLIKERGDNIYDTSANTYVNELIDSCIEKKKTVIYESMIIPKDGNNIWAQTTLTPILDENNEVTKLIAIDTDVGQLKTAEIEISNQKEELQAQSEMLADINEELERNNLLITDSISYAKRIQEAILPTETVIKKYFPESFIYFRPKDIVSGDFFWFLQPTTDE